MKRREAVVSAVLGFLGISLVKPEIVIASPRPRMPVGRRGLDPMNEAMRLEFERGEFKFFFTGWKIAMDCTILAGQILAWRRKELCGQRPFDLYYASSPGGQGGYKPFETFDISGGLKDTLFIDDLDESHSAEHSFDKAVRLRDDAVTRLLKVMREAGEAV